MPSWGEIQQQIYTSSPYEVSTLIKYQIKPEETLLSIILDGCKNQVYQVHFSV